METLKIMNLADEDCETGDVKILSDLITAFATRKAGKNDNKRKRRIESLLKNFIAFCSVLPQPLELMPNTMQKPSTSNDGTTDEQEQ